MKNVLRLMVSCMLLFAESGASAQLTEPRSGQSTSDRPGNLASPPAMVLMGASIVCNDFERSASFYIKGLGLSATPGANLNELVLQFPGGGSTLLCQKPRDANATPPVRFGISRLTVFVPDLRALSGRLTAAGYQLTGLIRVIKQFNVTVASVVDPDGNQLELVQRGEMVP